MPWPAGIPCTWRWVQPVASDSATSVDAEHDHVGDDLAPERDAALDLPGPLRFIVQFGIAPATNAVIEQTVVETPITYRAANTIALVVAATIEAIAKRAMRRPRISLAQTIDAFSEHLVVNPSGRGRCRSAR